MVFFSYRRDKGPKPKKLSRYNKAIIGSASGMIATALLHPLDLVKTRMQLYPVRISTYNLATKIWRCEGPRALYTGLTAAIMRQATYTTTRIAVYHWMYERYKAKYGIPGLSDKISMGVYASMVGALAGGPSDLVLVRLMADARKDSCGVTKVPHRRLYTSAIDCAFKICNKEGVRTLWRGGTLSLVRAACVGTVQVGTYTQTRDYLVSQKLAEGMWMHVFTSFVSGWFTAIVTLPIERVKVRYQASRSKLTYKKIFKGICKCGALDFWAGFFPYFLRLSVHTSLTYMFMQKITEMYFSYWNAKNKGPTP